MQRDFVIVLGENPLKNKYNMVNQVSCLKASEDTDFHFIDGQARKFAWFLYYNADADFLDEVINNLADILMEHRETGVAPLE